MSNVPGNRNKAFWLWFLCEKQRYLLRSYRRASLVLRCFLQQHQRSLWFSVRLGKFPEKNNANTTQHHILSFFCFSLISFPVERKKKVMARPRNALACKRGIHFANVLTLVVFVFFSPPLLLIIIGYSYGQQWLWAKHATAGTHELGARRSNYSTSGRHNIELGSCSTAGRHSIELDSW